jgi:hypothetical protein
VGDVVADDAGVQEGHGVRGLAEAHEKLPLGEELAPAPGDEGVDELTSSRGGEAKRAR